MSTLNSFIFDNFLRHEIAIRSIKNILKRNNFNMTLMLVNVTLLGLCVRAQEKKLKKFEKEIMMLKGD